MGDAPERYQYEDIRDVAVMSDSDALRWTSHEEDTLLETPIFSVGSVRRRSCQNDEASFITVNPPRWITVIAQLDDDSEDPRFLIVRQFRHGTGQVSFEFPAGAVEPHETPLQAAIRELREETGFESGDIRQVGAVSPNPAFMTNTTYTFWARKLRRVSRDLVLDENEILDVGSETLSSLMARIGTPPYASAITIQAWFFYLQAAQVARFSR